MELMDLIVAGSLYTGGVEGSNLEGGVEYEWAVGEPRTRLVRLLIEEFKGHRASIDDAVTSDAS